MEVKTATTHARLGGSPIAKIRKSLTLHTDLRTAGYTKRAGRVV